MWLIETKGQEDEDVPLKDARADDWCKTATKLTGTEWRYLKVPYDFFYSSKFDSFQRLLDSRIKDARLV